MIAARICPQCRRRFPIGHFARVTGYGTYCRQCSSIRASVWLRDDAGRLVPVRQILTPAP